MGKAYEKCESVTAKKEKKKKR
eukprot:SAG11_NODE_26011_length_351_cov_0.587302_1_plen_21_part_10